VATVIDFPTSPIVGQTYTFNGRQWIWDGSGWGVFINAGQTVSVFVVVTPYVFDVAAFPQIDFAWHTVNYV
jgi:hypothetical protein